MNETESELKPISQLFAGYEIPPKKARVTERGELLKFFAGKMSRSIPFMAKRLVHLSIEDMYYLQSDTRQAEARGIPFGAAFNKALQVSKK